MRPVMIDKNRQMQLRAFIHRHSKKATPIAVHVFMLLGVSLYTIFGAMIMQRIESESMVLPRQQGPKQQLPKAEEAQQQRIGKREIAAFEGSAEHQRHQIRHIAKIQQKYGYTGADCIGNILRMLTGAPICNATLLATRLVECRAKTAQTVGQVQDNERQQKVPHFGWTFADSVLFCFTVITTIGYGNVAPKTFSGQLFCILYALIGIPFTLLAIADLGKFLSEILESWEKVYARIWKRFVRFWRQLRGRPKFSFVSLLSPSDRSQPKDGTLDANNNNNNNLPPPQKKLTPTIILSAEDQQQQLDLLSVTERGELLSLSSAGDRQKMNGNVRENEDGKKRDEDTGSEKSSDHFEHTQAIPLLTFFLLYVFAGACLLSAYEPDMNLFKAIYFNFVSLTSIGLGDVIPQSETYMALTLLYIAVGLALTTIAIEIAADYLKKLHYFGRKIENVGNVVIWFGGKKLTMKQLVKNLGDQFNLPVHQVKTLDLDKFVDDAIKVEEGELDTLRPAPIVPKDLLEEGTLNFADDDTEIDDWVRQKTPSTSPEPEPEPKPKPEEQKPEPTADPEPEAESEHELELEPEPDPEAKPMPEAEEYSEPEPESEQETELEPAEEIDEPEPEIEVKVEEEISAETVTDEESTNVGTSLGTTSPDMERRKSNYSEEAWRRYLEYKKQWRKFRHTRMASPNPNSFDLNRAAGKRPSVQQTDVPRRPSSSMSSRGSFGASLTVEAKNTPKRMVRVKVPAMGSRSTLPPPSPAHPIGGRNSRKPSTSKKVQIKNE